MIFFAVPSSILRPKSTCKRTYLMSQFISLSSPSSVQSLDMSEENNHHCPDYTELRSNMQNLAKSGGITKALQAFRLMRTAGPGKPTVYDYNSLVNCYLKSENVCLHDLSALYTEMSTLGLYPNASTFNTFLKGLNLLGESKIALWVTIEMCNYAFTPSFSSLSNLLKKCSDSMDLEEAITVLDLMMGLFKEASNCLNKMATDACYYPTVRTYTTIIKCWCDNGRVQEALSLLSQMEKRGLNPDIVTYNIILRALSNQNMVDEIFDLFQTIYQKDIPPDCYTATALSGLLKKGNLVIARSLLRDIIVTCGSDIDVAVYNVDLYCLISCFKFKEVSSLIKRMRKKGIEPNNITFNTILKGFCESKPMDEALEYFKSLKNPDLVSFNTILSTACKKGDIQMVKMVIDLMGNEGFELNVVGFTCLMVYYSNVGEINDCLDVFEHMISCGPTPSMVTINALMFGLCKNGELEAAYWFLCNLESFGFLPDSRTYKILERKCKVEGLNPDNRIKNRMISILKEMITNGHLHYGS
ncbi:hypothetical protein LXL04_023361 [Taraxacum kok-saghyz]